VTETGLILPMNHALDDRHMDFIGDLVDSRVMQRVG